MPTNHVNTRLGRFAQSGDTTWKIATRNVIPAQAGILEWNGNVSVLPKEKDRLFALPKNVVDVFVTTDAWISAFVEMTTSPYHTPQPLLIFLSNRPHREPPPGTPGYHLSSVPLSNHAIFPLFQTGEEIASKHDFENSPGCVRGHVKIPFFVKPDSKRLTDDGPRNRAFQHHR